MYEISIFTIMHQALILNTKFLKKKFSCFRPTKSSAGSVSERPFGMMAEDQGKDFDFERTEMKYDSTGMFHWCPARNIEDCILVSISYWYRKRRKNHKYK